MKQVEKTKNQYHCQLIDPHHYAEKNKNQKPLQKTQKLMENINKCPRIFVKKLQKLKKHYFKNYVFTFLKVEKYFF